MSAPPRPPASPYCSLTDTHLQQYFTRDRIRQHLRRAGLLNKSGHIVTEAEYENRLKDIEITRSNQLKYEEAFLEVLITLGEEQYKLLCQEMEKIKKQLQYQFGRIEKKYARRIHPVKIRVTRDGHTENKIDIENFKDDQTPITIPVEPLVQYSYEPEIPERNRLDEILKKLNEFIEKMNTLAKINENNTFLLNLPETIRRFKENQEQIRKQQDLWKKDYDEKETKRTHEIKHEFELLRKQIETSTTDKRHIEQVIQTSVVIKDLRENISHVRHLYEAIPVATTQVTLNAAIKASEKETMKRENVLEQLARDASEHVKKMESRFNDASMKMISHAEVEKLIRDAIANVKPTGQYDNSELRKLIQDVNDKLAKLETRFQQFSQSSPGITNIHIGNKESSNQSAIKLESNSERVLLIEQRLTRIEAYLNVSLNNEMKPDISIRKVPVSSTATQGQPVIYPSNRQPPESTEKSNNNRKYLPIEKSNQTTTAPQSSNTKKATSGSQKNNTLTATVDPELHDNSVPSVQEELKDYTDTIQNLQKQIDNLNKIKLDQKAVDDLVKLVEQQNVQQINDLRKNVNKQDDDLSKFGADLASIHRQLPQKPTSTPAPPISKSLSTKKYTDEELQAIMPFIEPLPTFMMQMENEWDQFY
ncbi:unnamed protein product [Rotaria magnacalcarata]